MSSPLLRYAPPGVETVVATTEGRAMVRVGRDENSEARPDAAEYVRIDVLNSTLRMGPCFAVAVAEALLRHARSVVVEQAPSPSASVH